MTFWERLHRVRWLLAFAVVVAAVVLVSVFTLRDNAAEKVATIDQNTEGVRRNRLLTEDVVACLEKFIPCLQARTEAGVNLGLAVGRGPRGEPGEGIPGLRGLVGATGAIGRQGLPGEAITGATGAAGPRGVGIAGADGANGVDGRSGADATDEQVANAVAAYCGARGDCRGADGDNGKDGAAGSGPTDAEIAAAVDSYFATHTFSCQPDPLPATTQTCSANP